MTFADIVYGVLALLGLIDLGLITWAIVRARTRQTVVRLVASTLLIFGFVLSASQRLVQHDDLTIGLPLILCGLLLFVFVLPGRRGHDR